MIAEAAQGRGHEEAIDGKPPSSQAVRRAQEYRKSCTWSHAREGGGGGGGGGGAGGGGCRASYGDMFVAANPVRAHMSRSPKGIRQAAARG